MNSPSAFNKAGMFPNSFSTDSWPNSEKFATAMSTFKSSAPAAICA